MLDPLGLKDGKCVTEVTNFETLGTDLPRPASSYRQGVTMFTKRYLGSKL